MAIACLVPILGGGAGVVWGPSLLGGPAVHGGGLDSHFRYLSGLLLGLGLAFAATIPRIPAYRQRFRLLCFIVVIGGLSRAAGLLSAGGDPASWAALAMELGVTPVLTMWQHRISRT